jgi:RNA polymerase sigma-70 factor (ECF subfamily)
MAEGDNDAFRDLYQQTSSAVYGFALSILRNVHDAENVMHDAYLRIHRSAAAYQPMGKPMAWILTIAKNICLMQLRQQKRSVPLEPEADFVLPELRTEMDADDRTNINVSGFSYGFGLRVKRFEFSFARRNYHLGQAPNYISLSLKI